MNAAYIGVWLLVCLCAGGLAQDKNGIALAHDPDIDLTVPQLIEKYGYPVEIHEVKTSDGYILNVHRIPGSPTSPARAGKPAILLQHGLLCSSADWVVMGPGKGFGYILADAGYDVWMGNARGNAYSRAHVKLLPSQGAFWDFSWHDMGVFDLPAVIDHILDNTGEEKIFYAGHSQGTTMFYVLTSQLPEYNSKIRAMFSLAPEAFMSRMYSPFFRMIATAADPLAWALEFIGVHEFMPKSKLVSTLGKLICKEDDITQPICRSILFLIAGPDSQELNKTSLPVILGHTPAGAATKQFIHYAQEIQSKKFRQYDYKLFGNLKRYGSIYPPNYSLDKISSPVFLFYGDNDWLAHPKDVTQLYNALPNAFIRHVKFNHLDFLWGINAKAHLYDDIMTLMRRY